MSFDVLPVWFSDGTDILLEIHKMLSGAASYLPVSRRRSVLAFSVCFHVRSSRLTSIPLPDEEVRK